jgi:crossover junction endodeoxyribonuclease RuvC
MRVLGLDPSLRSTGFGIIELEGNRYAVLAYGTIKPKAKGELPGKLLQINDAIGGLIEEYTPEEVAVENPFYARNIQTALTLGQVRGAILVAVAGRGLPLFEYSPLEIKKAVTSYGQAEKGQVNAMVRSLLGIEEAVEEDASDALACAICHLNTRDYQKRFE